MAQSLPAEPGVSQYRADQMLDLARWASAEFATLRHADVLRIAEAAARAGAEKAEHYAEWAQRETGFGVVAHKVIKNRLCSTGIYEYYKGEDLVSHRVHAETKIIEVPKPAGVVFALTPSTNPVATIFFKILLCLLTRNAIVLGPHPAAIGCGLDAARTMGEAAEKAGAPRGTVQVVPAPNLELIGHIMGSPKTDVILATGGTPMVRAAYSSGNPALGVGPANAPAYVDISADVDLAAKCLADSKAFDNSILCTNESTVIVHKDCAEGLTKALQRQGGHFCSDSERARLEETLFPIGRFNSALIGKPAKEIAATAGIKVARDVRVLVVPLERIGDDYPLSTEKLCPVLGYFEVPDARGGLHASKTMVRYSGGGHSAAIHATDPEVILRYGAALNVLRVAVNAPCSTGAAGFDTNLAPTMTVGTGYFGRSAVAENLRPHHLVNWTKIAYEKGSAVDARAFEALSVHEPESSLGEGPGSPPLEDPVAAELRSEIRRIIVEELRDAMSDMSA